MGKWGKLPEWARWILCWPVIIVLTFLVGMIMITFFSFFLQGLPLPNSVIKIIAPAIYTVLTGPVFFLFIYLFVPRKLVWVTGFFVFLSTTFGILAGARWCFEIVNEQYEVGPFLQDILQTVAAVSVSWFWFLYFRKKFAQSETTNTNSIVT